MGGGGGHHFWSFFLSFDLNTDLNTFVGKFFFISKDNVNKDVTHLLITSGQRDIQVALH